MKKNIYVIDDWQDRCPYCRESKEYWRFCWESQSTYCDKCKVIIITKSENECIEDLELVEY